MTSRIQATNPSQKIQAQHDPFVDYTLTISNPNQTSSDVFFGVGINILSVSGPPFVISSNLEIDLIDNDDDGASLLTSSPGQPMHAPFLSEERVNFVSVLPLGLSSDDITQAGTPSFSAGPIPVPVPSGGFGDEFTVLVFNGRVDVVPEPMTITLLCLGGLTLISRRSGRLCV